MTSSLVEWSDDMSVGVGAIDLDHKQLITLIHLLRDAVAEADMTLSAMLLASVVREAGEHFRREEVILSRHRYPELREHAREHRAMEAKLEDLRRCLDRDGTAGAVHVLDEVVDLFVERLLPEDMRYKDWFAANGIDAGA